MSPARKGRANKLVETASKRRLAAIVAIDVAGYSTLMERDEEDTISRWRAARRSIIEPSVGRQSGRIVQTAGDGLLVEFKSPVRAVRCALEIQKAMVEANSVEPTDRRIRLRIGINAADIVVSSHGIEGHGINVAARVEKMSDFDGIIITAAVRQLVESALDDVNFVDLGRRRFHNMSRPIRTYRVEAGGVSRGGVQFRSPLPVSESAAPLIAVLPLRAPEDPDTSTLVDPIRNELIASLSRMHWLTTLSGLWLPGMNAGDPITSHYHHEADIRYTVSGNLRRTGQRVRATVELIETASFETKWAQTFEGSLTDGFDLEDRVVQGVIAGIEPVLRRTELNRVLAKPLDELNSYECVARAVPLLHRLSRRDFMEADAYLRRAISIDETSALPFAWRAWWHLLKVGQGWSKSPVEDLAQADWLVRVATDRDQSDYLAVAVSGHIAALRHDLESARGLVAEALHLNPNSAFAWTRSSVSHSYLGEAETALAHAKRAINLSRVQTHTMFSRTAMTLAYMVGSDYENAVVWGQRALQANPHYTAVLRMLAASLAHLGRVEEARRVTKHALEIDPSFRLSNFGYPLKRKDDMQRFVDGLRKAGMPE